MNVRGGNRPAPLNDQVSKQLSRMPVRDTRPEIQLRRAMHAVGLRFRIDAMLPGRPDIVLTRVKIAIFVDGCFWHSCPDHGVLPKNNREWWAEKLHRNVERDREKDEELRSLGWDVVHVWEHDDPAMTAEIIRGRWRTRLASVPRGHLSAPCGNLEQESTSGGSRGNETVQG